MVKDRFFTALILAIKQASAWLNQYKGSCWEQESRIHNHKKEVTMPKPLEYKGYVARVEYDDDAGVFHGEVVNTRDVITFEGTCVDDLRREFVESVEDYLDFCTQRGEDPEKPFSGTFTLRTTPELHRKIYISARQAGLSTTEWINRTIEKVFA
jgi:predicted HicB family RNase H-like nuclease